MATGVNVWSQTAATNASSDSAQNWAEGMAPSAVNDSARGGMASVAKWRDDLNGTIATGGTSTAYTVTTNQVFASLAAGREVAFAVHTDCGATVTLNVDGLGAKPLRSAPAVELVAAALKSGSVHRATYFTSNSGEWLLQGVDPTIIAASQVVTASINDAAVTLAKMENRAANKLIGRYTASTGVPQEVTVSTGLLLDTTSGNLTSAFPPQGAFKNLSIKVASNTTVTVAADFVTTTDGTTYQTTALSGTVNLGTNGAANALDASTIAIDTFYSIWAIAKADGTTAGLASTSATAPTLPTGYTFKARIGWVQTIHASATLYGTWQLGRRAQYVVGLAQTSTLPVVAVGISGSVTVPTWTGAAVARFVPTTASEIALTLAGNSANSRVIVAPNNSYGGINASLSTGAAPLTMICDSATLHTIPTDMTLESSNIYWAANANDGSVLCRGWVDNL